MNKFKHYFLSLFFCVSLLIGFSTIANAEEVPVKPYVIMQQNQFNSTTHNHTFGTKWFAPNNNTLETFEERDYHVTTYVLQNNNAKYKSIYMLMNSDNSVILDSGKTYTVRFRNFYYSMLADFLTTGYQKYLRNPSKAIIVLGYSDNSVEQITSYEITNSSGSPEATIEFNCTPEKDVTTISMSFENDIRTILSDYSGIDEVINLHSYFGEYNGDDGHQFKLEVESQESGLLKSVIEWLKGIKSKIDDTFSSVTNGFSNITSWLSNVVNNIIELPSKLWNLISEGLKNLFVPNEAKMTQYKEDWDMLLSQRFGGLYEVTAIFSDFVGNINESAKSNTINIPKVSLSSIGIPFDFGGYDVNIVPEGFEILIEAVKKIISISCTILVVNALRRRYDEVMG